MHLKIPVNSTADHDAESTRRSKGQKWFSALRLAIGICLIFWLFYRIPINQLRDVIRESISFWPWWLAGIAATFCGLTASSYRWCLILHSQQFNLKWKTVFRFFFIGQFFNAFLPGGCGGDVIRAFYAARVCERQRTQAATTVLVDRGIGLFTTLGFGCIMILLQLPLFLQHPVLRIAAIIMGGVACTAIFGLLILLYRNIFTAWPVLQHFEKSRFGSVIKKAYQVVFYFRSHPRILCICIAISLINLICLTFACICFAKSLQIKLPATNYFTMFPIITILTAIPLTPGGLGVRENLFAELFRAVGIGVIRTFPLSLLVYFGGLACSLVGGILYLFQSQHIDKDL